MGIEASAHYRHDGSQNLAVDYDIQVGSDRAPSIGGGLEFQLSDHPTMKGDPWILPEGQGWAWATKNGGEVRVTFSPPLPEVYAERGDPRRIRCMFFTARIRKGKHRQSMTISAPSGAVVRSQAGLPYAKPTPDWPVAFDLRSGPDVSFLNAAHGRAGSHGRLRREGERLVFEDGSVARFWGTNLTAHSLFNGTDADVVAVARRLSALGFNLVRLHHHDSAWVEPNIFASGSNTRSMDGRSFAALGRLVRALEDEGIYLWLDIHVGRKFKVGDGIRGFAEIDRSDSRGFDYVNTDLQAAWRDFARQYLTRKNPHTGRSFAEDAAIVAVLLTNENDVTNHFGNKMLRDKANPLHTRMFEDFAADFAADANLSLDKVRRTWEPGPSKLLLNELEHRSFVDSREFLRRIGVQALVATTNTWGLNPAFSLPALTAGDLIDVHSYGDEELLSTDPRTTSTFAHWIAAAQVADYPHSVSEWNVPWPRKDRFSAPFYVAAIASLQGWDIVMQYAYQQYAVGTRPKQIDQWSAADDPALMAQMPAVALLFRRSDMSEARRTYRLELEPATLYGRSISPDTSRAIRTLVEQSRLTIGLPDTGELSWDTFHKPPGQHVIVDPDQSFLAADAVEVASDTGEFVRNWVGGYQVINTPRSQVASGWLGGRVVELRDVQIALRTAKATVAVTSLDGRSVGESERLLLTVTAQAGAMGGGGALPLRSEPIVGTLRIRSECCCARRLRSGLEERLELLPLDGDETVVELRPDDFAHWLILERPSPTAGSGCE